MRISLAAPQMPVALNVQGKHKQARHLHQAHQGDQVRFGTAASSGVRFVAPMVAENVPAFDSQNPQIVNLYKELLAKAQTFSLPQVSGRRIGIVLVGESGRAYLGTNLEVKGSAPSDVVHGEAFALSLARQHGETGVKSMFLSLQPCGTCRQVVREIGDESFPLHFISDKDGAVKTQTIGELFPHGYTYANPTMNMFKPPTLNFQLQQGQNWLSRMETNAFMSARESYLPNPRKTWAGIAVKMKDGSEFKGNTANVSGPNPTITPMQDMMVRLVSAGKSLAEIDKVVLVEPDGPDYSYANGTKTILEKLAPNATFSYRAVKTV